MAYTVGTAAITVSGKVGNAIPVELASATIEFEGHSDGAVMTIDLKPGLARALREMADALESGDHD